MKVNSSYISKAVGLFTITVGCFVLARWVYNIPSFKNILPGIVSMKFNTAVCFIPSGIVPYLLYTNVGYQFRKNSTYDFLLPGSGYNSNKFKRLLNEFAGKSLEAESTTKLISLIIYEVTRF